MTPTPPPPDRFTARQSSGGSAVADAIVGGIQLACELVGGLVELLAGVLGLFG